ncbi:MAG: T9SS type A sorting domain-containing protein [Bacteroidia bacterium]|nr:T9SS type A sorting domain-containing protein [Bacteroidia bacterium]
MTTIKPNPVAAGAQLAIEANNVTKLTLCSTYGVVLTTYTNTDNTQRIVLTAPYTAGVYWLQVDNILGIPKRYKLVVQ